MSQESPYFIPVLLCWSFHHRKIVMLPCVGWPALTSLLTLAVILVVLLDWKEGEGDREKGEGLTDCSEKLYRWNSFVSLHKITPKWLPGVWVYCLPLGYFSHMGNVIFL